jgi:hypothetical protein
MVEEVPPMGSQTLRLWVGLGWSGFFLVPRYGQARVAGRNAGSRSRDREAPRLGTAAVEIGPSHRLVDGSWP